MQRELQSDGRFQKVTIARYSAFGAVRVTGEVSSEQDLGALREHINATVPDLQVLWRVSLSPPPSAATMPGTFPSSRPMKGP
jgi:hypothetical protein